VTETEKDISCIRLQAALNYYLPPQIAVLACEMVAPEFHPRYNCLQKEYRYHILNSSVRDPFLSETCLLYGRKLDAELLHTQAQVFLGQHDFSAFCGIKTEVESTVRTITAAAVWRDGEEIWFRFAADGFLFHMVRILVGTLLKIHEGKIAADSIPAILESKNRSRAGATVPPQGLFLWDVTYPNGLFAQL
jgi:tRNA pseudouridine38-40 synthase